MPQPRRTAWVLITTLICASAFVVTPALAADPIDQPAGADDSICSPGAKPTHWTDEFHPPQTIRVRRTKGPAYVAPNNVVQTWNFRQYVATVLRAEYSGAVFTSNEQRDAWYAIGAIAVKQYAWYYAMHWRGGKLQTATGYDCYDVADSTADQIFNPEKINIIRPDQEAVIDATWHMSLRKYMVKKKRNMMFLTGYRSGLKVPCASDDDGFRIKQKSMKDCITKGLTVEEVQREYYGRNVVEIVDVRDHDILSDGGSWRGDVGLLTPDGSAMDWRVFPALATGFGAAAAGSFALDPTSVLSHGAGDVDRDNRADLVVLVDAGGGNKQVRVAKATGSGYGSLGTGQAAGAVGNQMVVADFNGDFRSDVGLFATSGATATLEVMFAQAGGALGTPVDWWTGPLNPASQGVTAGDVNGDGKADLVYRGTGSGLVFNVALSRPSCSDLSAYGPCPASAVGTGLADATLWLTAANWSPGQVKSMLADENRDGRDDLFLLRQDGSDVKLLVARTNVAGGFNDAVPVWQSNSASVDNFVMMPFHGDADGYADAALFRKDTNKVSWIRVTPTGGTLVGDNDASWVAGARAF